MPKKTEIVEMPEALQYGEKTYNTHSVSKRAWRYWNNQARYIFNEVMNSSLFQEPIKHPNQPTMSDDQWYTIRWNMAWMAADAAMQSVSQEPQCSR